MKVYIEIELDETWDEYKVMPTELLMEDLFCGLQEKDGVKNVRVTNIKI
jgi:hypothetical protein